MDRLRLEIRRRIADGRPVSRRDMAAEYETTEPNVQRIRVEEQACLGLLQDMWQYAEKHGWEQGVLDALNDFFGAWMSGTRV